MNDKPCLMNCHTKFRGWKVWRLSEKTLVHLWLFSALERLILFYLCLQTNIILFYPWQIDVFGLLTPMCQQKRSIVRYLLKWQSSYTNSYSMAYISGILGENCWKCFPVLMTEDQKTVLNKITSQTSIFLSKGWFILDFFFFLFSQSFQMAFLWELWK